MATSLVASMTLSFLQKMGLHFLEEALSFFIMGKKWHALTKHPCSYDFWYCSSLGCQERRGQHNFQSLACSFAQTHFNSSWNGISFWIYGPFVENGFGLNKTMKFSVTHDSCVSNSKILSVFITELKLDRCKSTILNN